MPPKSKRKPRSDSSATETGSGHQNSNRRGIARSESQPQLYPQQQQQYQPLHTIHTSRSSDMAASVQTPPPPPPLAQLSHLSGPRPTLPPISHLNVGSYSSMFQAPYPSPTNVFNQSPGLMWQPPRHAPANTSHPASAQSQEPRHMPGIPLRPGELSLQQHTPYLETEVSPGPRSAQSNRLKRPRDSVSSVLDRPARDLTPKLYYAVPPPGSGSLLTGSSPGDLPDLGSLQFPRSSTGSISELSTPTAGSAPYPLSHYPGSASRAGSDYSVSSNAQRCMLHIRQQPRAARAGPDGKDRRAIDPPPVLQLLMNDFDPDSQEDLDELKSSFWVVHCRLVSPTSPKKDMSTLSSVAEDGSREIQRLLLGTAVASPFHTSDDPDLESVPTHPTTKNKTAQSGPPSPSSRFLPNSSTRTSKGNVKPKGKGKDNLRDLTKLPSAFFIFADISVRKAGEYRLEFSLMKIEAAMMMSGSTLPIVHSITSQVFKVVNAKDFDQVQPSTKLVRGLLERGAGFPLKLKKGTREGQRRRGRGGSDSSDDDDDDDDDDDEEAADVGEAGEEETTAREPSRSATTPGSKG